MSYIIQNACRFCQTIQQHSCKLSKVYRFYSKPNLSRGITSSSYYHARFTQVKEIKDSGDLFANLVEAKHAKKRDLNEEEHEVSTRELVDVILHPVDEEEVIQIEDAEVVPVKGKKKKHMPSKAKFEQGNQVTDYVDQNISAEIDIYVYLGEHRNALSLFNFHRRYGHKFNVYTYNKILHSWAQQKGWENIQVLLRNMKREGVESNYQTYAALLQCCGNIGSSAKGHVKKIVNEMAGRDMDIKTLLKQSLLTKSEIQSIIAAVHLIDKEYFKSMEWETKYRKLMENHENNDFKDLIEDQIDRELQGHSVIKSIESTKKPAKVVLKHSEIYQTIVQKWREDFIVEVKKLRKESPGRGDLFNRCIKYGSVLSPEEISDIIFDQIVPIIARERGGVPTGYICRYLGDIMYQRFSLKFQEKEGIVEKVRNISNLFCLPKGEDEPRVVPRVKWKQISEELYNLPSENLLPSPWTAKIKVMASSILLDVLKKIATVDTSVFLKEQRGTVEPSLIHNTEQWEYQKKIGKFQFHPLIVRLHSSYLEHVGNMSFEVNSLPMIVNPKPWLTTSRGGYLLLSSQLVRDRGLSVVSAAKLETSNLEGIYDSVNYAGATAWKVNGRVLDMMIQLFNGDGDAKLKIHGPVRPAEQHKLNKKKTFQQYKERQLFKKGEREAFSLRMNLLYTLSIANHFRRNVIHVPNNLDFRGRMYPLAPHGSHIGDDVSRSMLMFAEGRKLGPKGLDWLKVQVVNVHGILKKASLDERIKYADEHMVDIMDSADHPLTGDKWWQGSGDPWQTLIACMELTDAIRSGDPENFISHLPVQQDGSCNGLQHYAALGRDMYGAKQVNLIPSDRPQDVYSEVSNYVEVTRQKDAANGLEIARLLEGKINRKVVKQTVMTVVYGVTFVGGRLQVEKQLASLGVEDDIIFRASIYVVQEVFKGLAQMFTSARQIQEWLINAASQISLAGHCVDWVTPLNLPVEQLYYREAKETIQTPLQCFTLTTSGDYTQLPCLRKQKGGFPPNFIHSLDSTHMLMTSLRCQQEKLVFASVHDCFWTHACDVDKMNRFCREEFISLHKLPILDNLKKHFEKKYGGLPLRTRSSDGCSVAKFTDLPKRGDLNIENVLDSVYFFS